MSSTSPTWAYSRDPQALANAAAVFEVTSPSTEAYDRGAKLRQYQLVPALREIVIVSHLERRVEVWRRRDDASWSTQSFGPSDVITLAAVGCVLPVDEIYRDPLADA